MSRDSLLRFAKSMALTMRVMLAALDKHLKQNDSKMFIAKHREFVKCSTIKQNLSRYILFISRDDIKCGMSSMGHSRLTIANSAPRVSLAIYHPISNACSWTN